MKPVKAIILAGGQLEDCFKKRGENAVNKAFLPINKKPMVKYVIEAVKGASLVEEVILTVPQKSKLMQQEDNITLIESGKSIVDTVLNGVRSLPKGTEKVLLVMSDLPLLTSEAIDDFLLKCGKIEADYYYSILEKKDAQKNFKEFRHTYLKLKDGTFCGGGLTLLEPEICNPYRSELMHKMTLVRKRPLEMARILGPKILLKLAVGQAYKKDVEETAICSI